MAEGKTDESAEIFSIGRRDEARSVVDRFYRASSAYREFVRAQAGVASEQDFCGLAWNDIPLSAKDTLYGVAAFSDLLPQENVGSISSFLRSSGSSSAALGAKGFYWPQLRESVNASMAQWKARVIETFDLRNRRTLAIVGMGLGSWSGGDRYNLMFKTLALETNLPLTAFSPGTAHAEIVEIIGRFGGHFDQILVVVVPSAIFYLQRLAAESGVRLPYEKLAFIAPGEGFHEDLREHVREAARPHAITFISNYASADAELTGLESAELAEVRGLLNLRPDLAERLGFRSRGVPNLFHAFPSAGYLECVDQRMVLTRWQGLPLARYDLKDSVQLFSWQRLCGALARMTGDAHWGAFRHKPYGDVIAVYGRADQCIVFFGNNLFGSMLEEVLMRSSLGQLTTGHFIVWSSHEGAHHVLNWQIELKDGVTIDVGESERHYQDLVKVLAEQQPSFRANRSIFAGHEAAGLKVFKFHFVPEPALSINPSYRSGIKKRIVRPSGPL